MSYPQISESELRGRLRARGHTGKQLDLVIAVWQHTGMTVDEVMHLKWENIDLEGKMMRVPDIPARVYSPDEQWLQARAFEPEADEDDNADLPESALERFLPREHAELLEVFEPNRMLSRRLDVYGQALLAGWLEFATQLTAHGQITADLEEYCDDVAADGYELAPTGQIDTERSLLPILIGTTVNGTIEDIEAGGEVRLQDLADLLGSTLNTIERRQDGNPYGEGAIAQQVIRDIVEYDYDLAELVTLIVLVPVWQRMLWFAECALRQGAVLTPGRGEPLIGDEDEQLAYLLRLGAQQPGLAGWPELHRFVPRRAEGLLPMTELAYARFRKHGIPADPELSARLAEEIVERRHYLLSSVSVIELDELGIRRIVLTPEEQPLASISGNQGAFHLGFVVDHVAGGFYGKAQVFPEPVADMDNRRALVVAPLIMHQAAELTDSPQTDTATQTRQYVPPAVEEAIAAVELIVLSAWRDLVVAEVREQHYDIDRIRKAKGGNRKRAARRGDIEVIRYVPRRLLIIREERERAAKTGQHVPRRLYPVAAFSRRLPEGRTRSRDAELFAQESGIPLAPWQTVVRPHWRGGTEEERAHAAENPELDVRHWRSWSALDLLRTRLAANS